MFSRSSIGAAISCVVMSVLAAGCARPFPERLGWYGDHPNLYNRAFDAAAQDAVAKALTGQNYYDLLGDAAYQLSMDGICDSGKFDAYFVRKERACFLLGGPPLPGCANANGCAGMTYDPVLFSDPRIRNAVEAALRDPCDYLTPPGQVKHRTGVARFFMSADDNWRIMLCDREQVHGANIVFDDQTRTVRLVFSRGD